jgi:hypothetical protein
LTPRLITIILFKPPSRRMSILSVVKFPSVVEVYIPRILGSIRREYIIKAFERMNIGTVIDLDLHRKINENRNTYYFAFVKLHLYTSFPAANLLFELRHSSSVKLIYDRDTLQYWDIKTHLVKSERVANKSRCNPLRIVGDLCWPASPVLSYDIWSGFPDILPSSVYEENWRTIVSSRV